MNKSFLFDINMLAITQSMQRQEQKYQAWSIVQQLSSTQTTAFTLDQVVTILKALTFLHDSTVNDFLALQPQVLSSLTKHG